MENKAAIRREVLKRRRSLAPLPQEAMQQFSDYVVSKIDPRHTVIAGYWPMSGELDCRPALHQLHLKGYHCALPVVHELHSPLLFRRWTPEVTLEDGPHGTMHPPKSCPRVTPDVLLVPMVAFDQWGGRLGYGGGYYDRTLSDLKRRKDVMSIGLAFDEQEVERLPVEETDQKLDWIVTPTRGINTD